jgi:site-specific recombinase XerD
MNTTTTLAPLLQAFFIERLIRQRHASAHTIASCRDTFRLLLNFAQERLKKAPSSLDVGDLDVPFVASFLNYLEESRGNSARSRNVRLAAIHSFFRYVALREPMHSELAQRVLSIPTKRYKQREIEFLTLREVDALLGAPDDKIWGGRRDRALLIVAVQTGLRVSEVIGLRCRDIVFGECPYVQCVGKGRKERRTPLRRDTIDVLRRWLAEQCGTPDSPLFPNARGGHLSRDGVAYLIAKHVVTAERSCHSLSDKRVTPHVLRHTAAMALLQSGVDRSIIALWLGHESVNTTEVYLHADIRLKEEALNKTIPASVKPGRYRPVDSIMAFLQRL